MTLSPRIHAMLCLALLLSGAGLALVLSLSFASVVDWGHLNHYQCATSTKSSQLPVFRILIPTNAQAVTIAQSLCRAPALARHFSHVDISWQARDQLKARDLLEGRFNLIWQRSSILVGLYPGYGDSYKRFELLPSYDIYWLSQRDKPQLSAEYFAGKTLGFLNDDQSWSSLQLPLAQLEQHGIHLAPEQRRFYPDRISLYQAFMQGEVDLISGLRWIGEREIPSEHRQLIAANLSIGDWYLKHDAAAADYGCELHQGLAVLTPIYKRIDPHFRPMVNLCGSLAHAD
jgi:hypothetical protein